MGTHCKNAITPIMKHGIICAGILTFLGLKEKDKEEDPMITTIKRAVLCLQRAEYDKAETILHLALKVAQERQDMQAQRYIFDLLANVAYQRGDLLKAEKLFIQVMKELIASGTATDDNSIVEISLKLASIYSQTKEDTKAEEGFRFCVSTQEKKIKVIDLDNVNSLTDFEKDTALLWAMSVDWYARHLLARHSLKAAEENFQKALTVSEKINGPTHPQTLVLINDIGSVASLQKNYDKAIQYFQKVITTADDASEELPAFYCNLGATYLLKGDVGKAKDACSKALKIAQNTRNEMAEKDAKQCLEEIKLSCK